MKTTHTHQTSDKAVRAAIRENMKETGFFNRPNHRVHRAGTEYKRNPKHKGKGWEE